MGNCPGNEMSAADSSIEKTLALFSQIYLGGIPSVITNDSAYLVRACVFGFVNHTHPTFTELGQDLVMADGGADHDGSIVPLCG